MSRAYLDRASFVQQATEGKAPENAVLRKQFIAESIKAVEGDAAQPRTRQFIVSTGTVDRDNDSVAATGWHLDNYRKNPVVLFAHDYTSLPIGKCTDIRIVGGQLVATAEFADHDMANTVLRLIDGGFLNATSVGFRPMKYALNEQRRGMDFSEQELLEFSVVPVPANPEALVVSRELNGEVESMKGWARKTLELLDPDAFKPVTATADAVAALGKQLGDLATAVAKLETPPTGPAVCPSCNKPMSEAAGSGCNHPTGHMQTPGGGPKDASGAVDKKGRVLSARNESKIRAAHQHLDEVLSQLPQSDDGDGDGGDDGEAALEMVETKDVVADDVELLDLEDSTIAETLAEAMKELATGLRADLVDTVKRETTAAIARARGRIVD